MNTDAREPPPKEFDCCHSDSGSDGDAMGCRSSESSADSRPRCDGCRQTFERDACNEFDCCHSISGSDGDVIGRCSSESSADSRPRCDGCWGIKK